MVCFPVTIPGGAQYRVIQEITDKLSDAIKGANVDIVPKTVVNMGGSEENANGTILDTLLKLITVEKLGVPIKAEQENAVKKSEEVVEILVENESKEASDLAKKADASTEKPTE